MNTGLVAALPAEISCLTRQEIYISTPFRINNVVIVIISGIGAKLAEKAAVRLLFEKVDRLVSWGTAAGLTQEIHSGDLLLPAHVMDKKGTIYDTDNTWTSAIRNCLDNSAIKIHNGTLVETTTILETPEQKKQLAAKTMAIAADMETAAIMRVAKSNNLPCSVIRTVVDEAQEILPYEVIKHTDIYGNPNVIAILHELFFKPHLIPRLYHLAGAMRTATRTLSRIAQLTGGLSLQTS